MDVNDLKIFKKIHYIKKILGTSKSKNFIKDELVSKTR